MSQREYDDASSRVLFRKLSNLRVERIEPGSESLWDIINSLNPPGKESFVTDFIPGLANESVGTVGICFPEYDLAYLDTDILGCPIADLDSSDPTTLRRFGVLLGVYYHEVWGHGVHSILRRIDHVNSVNLMYMWTMLEEFRIEHHAIKANPGCQKYLETLVDNVILKQADDDMPISYIPTVDAEQKSIVFRKRVDATSLLFLAYGRIVGGTIQDQESIDLITAFLVAVMGADFLLEFQEIFFDILDLEDDDLEGMLGQLNRLQDVFDRYREANPIRKDGDDESNEGFQTVSFGLPEDAPLSSEPGEPGEAQPGGKSSPEEIDVDQDEAIQDLTDALTESIERREGSKNADLNEEIQEVIDAVTQDQGDEQGAPPLGDDDSPPIAGATASSDEKDSFGDIALVGKLIPGPDLFEVRESVREVLRDLRFFVEDEGLAAQETPPGRVDMQSVWIKRALRKSGHFVQPGLFKPFLAVNQNFMGTPSVSLSTITDLSGSTQQQMPKLSCVRWAVQEAMRLEGNRVMETVFGTSVAVVTDINELSQSEVLVWTGNASGHSAGSAAALIDQVGVMANETRNNVPVHIIFSDLKLVHAGENKLYREYVKKWKDQGVLVCAFSFTSMDKSNADLMDIARVGSSTQDIVDLMVDVVQMAKLRSSS